MRPLASRARRAQISASVGGVTKFKDDDVSACRGETTLSTEKRRRIRNVMEHSALIWD
jgi:hypothetical protein